MKHTTKNTVFTAKALDSMTYWILAMDIKSRTVYDLGRFRVQLNQEHGQVFRAAIEKYKSMKKIKGDLSLMELRKGRRKVLKKLSDIDVKHFNQRLEEIFELEMNSYIIELLDHDFEFDKAETKEEFKELVANEADVIIDSLLDRDYFIKRHLI